MPPCRHHGEVLGRVSEEGEESLHPVSRLRRIVAEVVLLLIIIVPCLWRGAHRCREAQILGEGIHLRDVSRQRNVLVIVIGLFTHSADLIF